MIKNNLFKKYYRNWPSSNLSKYIPRWVIYIFSKGHAKSSHLIFIWKHCGKYVFEKRVLYMRKKRRVNVFISEKIIEKKLVPKLITTLKHLWFWEYFQEYDCGSKTGYRKLHENECNEYLKEITLEYSSYGTYDNGDSQHGCLRGGVDANIVYNTNVGTTNDQNWAPVCLEIGKSSFSSFLCCNIVHGHKFDSSVS